MESSSVSYFSRKDSSFGILIFGSVIFLISASKPYSLPGLWMKHTINAIRGKRPRIAAEDSKLSTQSKTLSFSKPQTDIDASEFGEMVTRENLHQREDWRSSFSIMGRENLDSECELSIINELEEPVYLCWIDGEGNLRGMRPINDKSIRDNSVSNQHTEYCYAGHAFVCLVQRHMVSTHTDGSGPNAFPQHITDVSNEALVFRYKPCKAKSKHIITLIPNNRKGFSLRTRNVLDFKVKLECRLMSVDDMDVVDTTSKEYVPIYMHGFEIRCEPQVFEEVEGLESIFNHDLETLVSLLPPGACEELRRSTPIYINKSIRFGKKNKPIEGKTCTFHPLGGANWLRNNGLSVSKEGSIEIQCAKEYLQSRNHWGTGGILVHEFAHAYHNKCCPNSYDNEIIAIAYEEAMKKHLYDRVRVHGPQGEKGLAKAYACTNCMEFFAELSVAYLWGKDDQEYNKWYPFNRKQLLEHDPESFHILDNIWKRFEKSYETH